MTEIQWECPHCGTEGTMGPEHETNPLFDHERPDGVRCYQAQGARVALPRFDPEVVEQIARLAAESDHTGALVVGARMLRADGVLKRLVLLQKLQGLDEGHLAPELQSYRGRLGSQLYDWAKRHLTEVELTQFTEAFTWPSK